MTGVQLGLVMPEDEWDEFLRQVEDRCYTTDRAGSEIERTWREWREIQPVEERANQLLGTVGLGTVRPEKTKRTRHQLTAKETTTVWVSVHPEVKDEMGQYADAEGVQQHEVLRWLVNWYIEGGLLGRLADKLERVVPEVEAAVAELDESTRGSDEDDGSLSQLEQKRRWLARQFVDESGTPTEFTSADFGEAIEAMPYRGSDTKHMREKYLGPVLDRLGFTEHPRNPKLFVPVDRARELAEEHDLPSPDAPAFERKGYDDLDADQRTLAVRVAAIREASRRGGKGRLTVKDVRGDGVFREGGPSDNGARSMMERAGDAEGFAYVSKHGTTMLRCDAAAVSHDLLAAADESPSDGATGSEVES